MGYIQSELSDIAETNPHGIDRATALASEWNEALSSFAALELQLYREARTAERTESIPQWKLLTTPLNQMRHHFESEIVSLDREIRRQDNGEIVQFLLMACGAEMITAAGTIADCVEAFIRHLEDQVD